MGFLAVVSWDSNFRVTKYKAFKVKKEADDHILKHEGFVVVEPDDYALAYCTVDPALKTIVFDSSSFTTDRQMVMWKDQMEISDSNLIPRWFEDHLENDHGGVSLSSELQNKYNDKKTLRATKPS